MINDPYSILEISPNATNEEVKRAYREMSRKYHPDSYSNNPLAELAEEKFKEVQVAYDQIMKEREGGFNSGWGQSGSQGSSQDSSELSAVASYINSGRYNEALNMLAGISNRTARWYYYSSIANAGVGNNIQAQNDARQAVNMEPNNMEYRKLLNQMQWSGQRYQTNSYGNGRNRGGDGCSTGNCCCDMWILDSCCECTGGDLCSCM